MKVLLSICTITFLSLITLAECINPAGIIIGGDSHFKVSVKPDAYPDRMISWIQAGSGAVDFPDGNTGRDVEFLAKVEGFCGKYDDVTRRIIYGDLMKSCTNITSTIERRRSVCAFVLARLADETANADVVDDILLAADKDYATSERRKAFLSRVTDDKCLFQSRRCELEKRLENLTAKPMLATQDE